MSRFTVLLGALALLPCVESAKKAAPGHQPLRVQLRVNNDGFVVANATALTAAGVPVTLVVTRVVETTCATDLVLKVDSAHLRCAMGMADGDLRVEFNA